MRSLTNKHAFCDNKGRKSMLFAKVQYWGGYTIGISMLFVLICISMLFGCGGPGDPVLDSGPVSRIPASPCPCPSPTAQTSPVASYSPTPTPKPTLKPLPIIIIPVCGRRGCPLKPHNPCRK
jgi:hypothetical protein